MGQIKNGASESSKRIEEITEMIETAKDTDSLNQLNEYLRKLVMGHYGDTKFDVEDIRRQTESNQKWRKRSLRKRSKRNH